MEQSKESYQNAIKNLSELHGNMAVLSKLDGLLKEVNSDVSNAVKLVQTDGALSASVVKLSNTALYGMGKESSSLGDALQKVGFAETLKIVSMVLSRQVFMRDLKAYGISADSYWRYSFFTATFMENEAKAAGLDASRAYLLGLLHSLGRVVMDELLHASQIEIFWDRMVPPGDWEVATFGFTSDHAGGLLLKNWKFGSEIYKRVAFQSDEARRRADTLLQLLDFARLVAIHGNSSETLEEMLGNGNHLYVEKRGYSADDIVESRRLSDEQGGRVDLSLKGAS